MHDLGRRQFLHLTTALAAAVVTLSTPALAQTGHDKDIAQFLANPSKTLKQYPNGGAQLISLIRDVAVAHPDALKTIIALLSSANASQQTAIGSGLGQAAQIVVKNNPKYANQIQQAIVAACTGAQGTTACGSAAVAFAAVTGNTEIAAIGGGGGGGGGFGGGGGTGGGGGVFGGGPPRGGPNSAFGGAPGSFHYQTAGFNPFTGGGGIGSGGSTSPH